LADRFQALPRGNMKTGVNEVMPIGPMNCGKKIGEGRKTIPA